MYGPPPTYSCGVSGSGLMTAAGYDECCCSVRRLGLRASPGGTPGGGDFGTILADATYLFHPGPVDSGRFAVEPVNSRLRLGAVSGLRPRSAARLLGSGEQKSKNDRPPLGTGSGFVGAQFPFPRHDGPCGSGRDDCRGLAKAPDIGGGIRKRIEGFSSRRQLSLGGLDKLIFSDMLVSSPPVQRPLSARAPCLAVGSSGGRLRVRGLRRSRSPHNIARVEVFLFSSGGLGGRHCGVLTARLVNSSAKCDEAAFNVVQDETESRTG